VLLIACANVGTVLLAKATARTREVAIRTAMGAGRGRIALQLLTESLLLALLAGGVGTAIGAAGSQALLALAPRDLPRLSEVGMDPAVYAFTLAVSMLTTLVFGLAPALQTSRVDLNDTLKRGGARTGFTGGTGRLQRLLVVGEIALSVILVTAAGLLLRSLVALNNVELGFQPARVLVMDASIPGGGERAAVLYRELIADLSSAPGVLAAGAGLGIPGRVESGGAYWVDHLPADAKVEPDAAVYSVVTPGYLSALSIPLKRGRDVTDADAATAPRVALINEALAEKDFKGQDPIGRTLYAGYDGKEPMTIVGIVGNVRQWSPTQAPAPEIFMPYAQHVPATGTALRVLVKSAGPPEALENLVQTKVRARSTDIPMRFSTMERVLQEYAAAARFRTLLVTGFGVLALGLALAGVYGVLSYTVGQRTGEIGLRMALGAQPSTMRWMVLRDGGILAICGMVIGLFGAVGVSRLLSAVLFEVKPYDPLAYLGGLGVLTIVTFAACYVPAARAASVDPLTALRVE
jgi:putative ABC transport system permease protein